MWIPKANSDNDNIMTMSLQTRLLRLFQAYPVAVLFHLNDKGCHYDMKRLSRLGEAQFYDRVQVEFDRHLLFVTTSRT